MKPVVCKNCSGAFTVPVDTKWAWCKHCGVFLKVLETKEES